MNVTDTLDARHATHGKFQHTATMAQEIKRVMRGVGGIPSKWDRLDDAQQEALDLIATKIGRLLSGNPAHVDTWHDIAGYAQLIADRLDGIER